MIRTLLAVLVVVALVAVAMPAVERGAAVRSEEDVRADVASIAGAATSLVGNEELPPEGYAGPRRVLTVRFPDESLTSRPVDYVRISRERDTSAVAYRIAGRTERVTAVDVPLVAPGGGPVELGGSGAIDLRLTLTRDGSDDPLVIVEHA